MKRKIVDTGSCLAVTLPADIVEELGLKTGDEVEVNLHPVTKVISIQLYEGGQVTTKVEDDIDRLLRENAVVYERLAK